MVVIHTDELPIDEEDVKALAAHIFRSIDDPPDEVHIWDSDRSHYHGRDRDNEAHIGINVSRLTSDRRGPPPLADEEEDEEELPIEERTRYVIAHEFGHDIAERDFGDNDGYDIQEHIDEDGKLDSQKGAEHAMERDPEITVSRTVASELMAELAAEETVSITDPYDRNPFPDGGKAMTDQVADLTAKDFYVRNSDRVRETAESVDSPDADALDYLSGLPRSDFRDTSVFKDSPKADKYGVEAFVDRRGSMETLWMAENNDMDAISYRLDLLENIKKAYQNDNVDVKDMLKIAWTQDAARVGRGYADEDHRETPFFEAIDRRLDIDYDKLEDNRFTLIRQDTPADEVIEEQQDEIVYDVIQESVQEIEKRLDNLNDTYGSIIPDPDNSLGFPTVSQMTRWLDEDQEAYADATYDFSHQIGCTLGQILHERGVTIEEVAQDMETYNQMAREAVEESMGRGYQQHVGGPDEVSIDDFRTTANFLIDKYVNRDQYTRETDYLAAD